MSSRSQVKLYISRGVQTEDDTLLQSPRRATQPLLSSDCMPAGELATPSLGLSSENLRSQILGALAYESAYTRPQASEYSDLLPLISCYKTQKYAGLDGNRPSHTHVVSKRVVSLPDPSVQEAVMTERNIRIVSMPEFTRASASKHRTFLQSSQTNSSFSSDASRNSEESPDQRWHLNHDKMYPVDIPQTPSPPSSPDSVVIIGNEPHVSGSFLRRSCSDDGGWVTWASSPPRPIPALHGPLSLPYARCPSGAEGTVIEGDDLSHKIWGLGVGEAQTNAHTSKIGTQQPKQMDPLAVQTTFPCKTIPAEPYQDPQQSAFQRQRDDVIDLSMPSTFYAGGQTSSVSDRYTTLAHRGQLYFPMGTGGNQTVFPSEDTRMGHGLLRLGPNESSANRNHPNPLGLSDNSRNALNLPASTTYRGTGQLGGNAQNRLNKSAPIFIPGIDWNSKSAYMQQKENDTSALDTQHSRRVELLQQRHLELLTPPSTSSPRWSPVFSHPVDIELSKGPYGDPKIYSPRSDLDDYSNKLMAMIQQIKHQDLIDSAKRYTLDTTRQAQAPIVQKGPVVNSATRYHQEQPHPKPASSNTNVSHVSSDFRRDLSQQHPRSIPLARLIQRRLSSVAEEDANILSNSPSPLLPKAHPRLSLEPLIYRLPINRQEVQLATKATASIVPSRPSAETMDDQTAELESNAIVKLPRKCATHRAPRTSSGPPSKRPPRHDIKKDKNDTEGLEDKSTSEVAARKGRNGQSKKSEGKSGHEAPA